MNKIALVLVMLHISFLCYSESKVVDSISWEDKGGSHVITIYEEISGVYFEPNWKSKVIVEKKTLLKKISKLSWDIKDFSMNSAQKVNYVLGSLNIFDIDNDGIMESIFTYAIKSDGLDPDKIKQMVHKGDVKFAIRGNVPKELFDIDEYNFKIDSEYSSQPIELMIFSLNHWNRRLLTILEKL
jgi:hypothetical protein